MARTKSSKLSERQIRILDFITNFVEHHGYPPSIREIGKAVSIGSTSVVNYNLNKLGREGYIVRDEKVSRGLQVIKTHDSKSPRPLSQRINLSNPALRVPMVGQIVASRPVESFEIQSEDTIDVPASMVGKIPMDEIFALRVSGNSMVDAMVADGDTIILRRQEVAENGDMVAVWLRDQNENTLKYFFRESPQRVRLQPANPYMDPIYVESEQVQIQGRVLGVIRSV
jgi:repressor LexA